MAKSANQKPKLLYLARILYRETDDAHGLTLTEIAALLERQGIAADRKTLYTDIEELRTFGMDINRAQHGRRVEYSLGEREFQLPELKLLVDSVQASRFITERKTRDLIRKLEGLVSRYEAVQLQRQVVNSGRIKSMNETIYYSVDTLHSAMAEGTRIRFRYFRWDMHKRQVLRHGGKEYLASPWALVWNSENYYLLAYDGTGMKTYRVDKMLDIRPAGGPREGAEAFRRINIADYSSRVFGMYGGEPVHAVLEADESLAGVFIDRFGSDVMLVPAGEGRFRALVDVEISNQFIGWVVGLGSGVRITEPPAAVEAMRRRVEELRSQYPAQNGTDA